MSSVRGCSAEFFPWRRCRCGSLGVRDNDRDNTASCVTIRGIIGTRTPMSHWGSLAGSDESSASTTMQRCSFANSIGKMRRACHLPWVCARAARTVQMSPHAKDQGQPTPDGHPVRCTPYLFSLPFYVPWPLPYANGWAQRRQMKHRKTWATIVVLLTEIPPTHADHCVQPCNVHKCSRRHVHPLHPQAAVATIGFAVGKGPSQLVLPIVAEEPAPQ